MNQVLKPYLLWKSKKEMTLQMNVTLKKKRAMETTTLCYLIYTHLTSAKRSNQRKWISICVPTISYCKDIIFPTKYDKPMPVIAYFDTGVVSSILKLDILPSSHGNSCAVPFRAANGQNFTISLIGKPIYIQLFRGYTIKTKVYMSELPVKYYIFSFDILHSLKRISWHPKGLKHRNHLLPWTTIPHLYPYGYLESYQRRDCQNIMCHLSIWIPHKVIFPSLEDSTLLHILALQEEWRYQSNKSKRPRHESRSLQPHTWESWSISERRSH